MLIRFARSLFPISIAQHWSKLQLERYLRRYNSLVFHASPLSQCVHQVWRIWLDHPDIAIVSFIEDKEISISVDSDHLGRIKQVLSLRSISESLLRADSRIGVHVLLIDLEPAHTVIVLIRYVGHSWVGGARVGKVLLGWSQRRKRDILDAAEV